MHPNDQFFLVILTNLFLQCRRMRVYWLQIISKRNVVRQRLQTLRKKKKKRCGTIKIGKSAVSSTTSQNQIDLESNVSSERSKRQLLSTVTPDRNEQKKLNKLERNPKSSTMSLFQQTSEQAALQTQDNFLLSTENRESSANFLEYLPNIDRSIPFII